MPRIRTIKPEFWSHPVLGRQDDSTRLMAIALLNYADDEGYFHAEPNLVRGFCRPFDDNSTITRRCLDNLSKIGYVTICENEFYGPIGRIEKFLEHQKIDRASNSKLKQYYSTNPRRILDDQSSLEQGTGNREQGTGNREGKNFSPPSLEEVKAYCQERNNSVDWNKWINHYQANGWMVGKNKMKDWKAAVRTWENNSDKTSPSRSAKKQEQSTHSLFNQA